LAPSTYGAWLCPRSSFVTTGAFRATKILFFAGMKTTFQTPPEQKAEQPNSRLRLRVVITDLVMARDFQNYNQLLEALEHQDHS
jgi:hypothetical protein